jgi:hypothetical protein
MTDDENALYQRAKRLGYNVRGELTVNILSSQWTGPMDAWVAADIERIQRWLDQIERGSAARLIKAKNCGQRHFGLKHEAIHAR